MKLPANMPFICLPKEQAKKFREALKGRELKIEELMKMTTEARTKVLEKYAGEQAKTINTLFEEKIILKNRVLGLKNWASKVGQIGRYDPLKKAQIEEALSEFRAKQQERIFNPKEYESFLSDLAEKTLGTSVTKAEAKTVFELSQKVDEFRTKFDEVTEVWTSEKSRLEYGASRVAFEKYIESLKGEGIPLRDKASGRIAEFKQEFSENRGRAAWNIFKDVVNEVSNISISFVASIDMSFLGRQGLRTLMRNPKVWKRGSVDAFRVAWKTLKGERAVDAILADVYSNPNFIKGRYEKGKILPNFEEQFPTSIPEKIPYFGRIFGASKNSFDVAAIRMRTGLFDWFLDKQKKNGINIDDPYALKSTGDLVNSMTARGRWGKTGEPGIVRLLLWAPRMIKANIDILTAHIGQNMSPFAQKQAAINLLTYVVETAIVMNIANALIPGSAETDSRSSDFGKIRVGNTRFDITGGAASLVTLASRLVNQASKSSTTGIITPFGTGFGEISGMDVIYGFLENKTTPFVSAIIDILRGETFKKEKPTFKNIAYGTFVPISIQNAVALKDDASASAVLGVIADVFGIGGGTFKLSNDNWEMNITDELEQFKDKYGDEKFKEANDAFNKSYSEWLNKTVHTDAFRSLSDEDKKKVLTDKKKRIKDSTLKSYGFAYKQNKKKSLPEF